MALSPTPLLFSLTTGVLIGAAQAGTTYAVIYGVALGRQISAERRSWAMVAAAAAPGNDFIERKSLLPVLQLFRDKVLD